MKPTTPINTTPEDENTTAVVAPPMAEVEYAISSAVKEGESVEDVLARYDEQVDKRESSEEKQEVLILKSRYARRVEQFDIAVNVAKQAYDMDPNGMATRNLADTYRESGNKEQALEYYKKLLEMSSASEDGAVVYRGPTVEEIIRELES